MSELTRKERLLEALRKLEAIDGSADQIESIRRALEDLTEQSQ